MGNIVELDDLTINKIAAGEVIERPANVVKELVENSIDAGANNIIIEVKKGGKSFIKIIDNGIGIAKDDLIIAFERHATSKIRRIEDLEKIYSMGFRGEALASIASISKFTMISRTKNDEIGTKLILEGGNIKKEEEIGCGIGSTMIIENLFFNVPVRYKFLKQDSSELRYIKEWVQKTALGHTNIAFKLISDGKNIFQSSGNGKINDIIYLIYGKEIEENIVSVNYEEENIKISGVVGNTFTAKDNRKGQIVFLNRRNIKNPILINSADQAFKGSIGIGKYGFYILNIEMPANLYDVNVHPTKSEVRFKNEEQIFGVLYRAIKSGLLSKDYLGNNEISTKQQNYVLDEFNFATNHLDKTKIQNNENRDDIIKRENKRKVEYKFIGISFKTYIMIEIDGSMYLIDQHAAHERVLYEQIKNNYKKNLKNNTQMILLPEIIELKNSEVEFIKNNLELIKHTGFDIEFFGDKSIKINGIPDIEYRKKTDTKTMFLDILDEMINNTRSPIKDIEERFIATVACKAAVKAGMELTLSEVDYLIQNLLNLQNPYTCPHGRPTAVKFAPNGEIQFL